VEVNYGAITNFQLHLIAPLAYDTPREGPSHYGFSDTEIGAKCRFIQETEHFPQVGIFPLLEIPTGSESAGLGSGHVQAFLPVWLQKSWGEGDRKWTAYGGGGYDINPDTGNRNWTFLGLVLQRQITDRVLLGGEIYHRTATTIDSQADTAFNLGAVIHFSNQHHLLFSAGRSIVGPTEFQVYAAYQLTLGPREMKRTNFTKGRGDLTFR